MKLNKKHLPFYAAFVQTAQYTLAGWLFMGWVGAICVGLMGSLVSLAIAYATSQFSDIAEKRKGSAKLFLAGLMLFSPILIGTATFIHLEQVTNLIWRGIVCAAWGFLPDGATALAGFIAGKGLVEQESRPKTARNDTSKPKGKRVVAGKSKGKTEAIAQEALTTENLIAYIAKETKGNKKPSQSKIAEHFGVTRQAIGQRLGKLKPIDVTQEMNP